MKIKEIIQELESRQEFQEWKKENQSAYLAHLFKIMDEENKDIWQFGYYNPEKDDIAAVMYHNDHIELIPGQEVFKRPGSKVLELELEKVKVSLQQADEMSENIRKEKYSDYKPLKKVMILQNLSEEGNVWNITFFSNGTSTLNIKVSAEDPDKVSDKLLDLIDKERT